MLNPPFRRPVDPHDDRRVADRVFGSALTAPKQARVFVRHQLGAWELPTLLDTAELLVSELVTNAVHATNAVRNAPITSSMFPVALRMVALRLRVSSGPRSLFIEVWDVSDREPVAGQSDDDDEGGRGLALVGSLARNWGHYTAPDRGKIVWCEIPLPPLAPPPLPAARVSRVPVSVSQVSVGPFGRGPASGTEEQHRGLPRRVRHHPCAPRAQGPDEATLLRVLDGLRGLDTE
ncbi:ATP-binding protein [Planotetraspora thailandica]|nr:ATP-binding protein [Planotetraspora thailandica]